MKIYSGGGITEFGPGVQIDLKGNEIARAIYTYLYARGVHIDGAATIRINGELCEFGEIYVDPSARVIARGKEVSGRKYCAKTIKIK